MADVLEAVTEVTGVDPTENSRQRHVIRSRKLACHALREINEMSYTAIAYALGYEDHTTVIHHCSEPVDFAELRAVLDRVAGETDAPWREFLVFKWAPA